MRVASEFCRIFRILAFQNSNFQNLSELSEFWHLMQKKFFSIASEELAVNFYRIFRILAVSFQFNAKKILAVSFQFNAKKK
jgi:hypothetical protein